MFDARNTPIIKAHPACQLRPVVGYINALILGIDRFMSECRALTNLVGNAVATLVVAGWENALDRDALKKALG